jgi:putative transposase
VAPDQVGGYRRPALEGEREWVLARIAEKPDLMLRALAAELAAGVKAGQYAVWSFFKREGLTVKKNSARGRTGPAGRGAQAEAVERSIRTGLIQAAWSSSTRPGPRPT